MTISKESFLDEINKYEGIVCYGIGKRFKEFKDIFCESKVKEKLLFCIDNNPKFYETTIQFAEKEVNVYPVEYLKHINSDSILVVITCNRFLPIEEQLRSDPELNNIHTYVFSFLYGIILEDEEMKKEVPLNIRLSEKPLIPKVIHYFWFGDKNLPDKNKKWLESWNKFCPDYDIKLWNENNYDVTKNPYMKEAYENKKFGFVPDYARLDIVYQYGGIYLDTDVELVQNMDELLYEEGFICFQSRRINLGSGFGAQKSMPMIKVMMEDYQNRHFVKEDGSLDLTSSNTIQTQLLQRMGLQLNGEYQIINGLTVFPEKMLCGKHDMTRNIKLKPYTRAIHHLDGSWLDEDLKRHIIYMEKNRNK